jgi:hypothetical protein
MLSVVETSFFQIKRFFENLRMTLNITFQTDPGCIAPNRPGTKYHMLLPQQIGTERTHKLLYIYFVFNFF